MPSPVLPSKTVVVLGASYGGARAARLLSLSLPHGWRLIVIDRNSHMNRESGDLRPPHVPHSIDGHPARSPRRSSCVCWTNIVSTR